MSNSTTRQDRYYYSKTSWACTRCYTKEEICGEEPPTGCKATCLPENVNLGERQKSIEFSKQSKIEEQNYEYRQEMDKIINSMAYRKIASEHFEEVKYCIRLKEKLPEDNLYASKEYMSTYYNVKQRNSKYKKKLTESKDISQNLKGSLYYWVTISPPEDQDPQLLFDLMSAYEKKALFKDAPYYAYVFEWRKHDPPSGFHCHILIDRRTDSEPNKDKRDFNSTYKKIYGIAPTNISVFISGIKSDKVRDNKYSYLQGNKTSSKQSKVDNDKVLRLSYGLKDIYESTE